MVATPLCMLLTPDEELEDVEMPDPPPPCRTLKLALKAELRPESTLTVELRELPPPPPPDSFAGDPCIEG